MLPKQISCNRYLLTINNQKEGKTICVIMQNPNTANIQQPDYSVSFLEKAFFDSESKEYEIFSAIEDHQKVITLLIVNLFSLRYGAGFNPIQTCKKMEQKNERIIAWIVKKVDVVIFAWGSTVNKDKLYASKIELVKNEVKKYETATYELNYHPAYASYAEKNIEKMKIIKL